ncbi:MAG: hypothetical protein JWM18_5146 [Chloroflexi bacterium]|jgi:hypothetical protein|nr:hypothetical protein [Chloroflexota bacterium]
MSDDADRLRRHRPGAGGIDLLEFATALCVGYRTLTAAAAALDRPRDTATGYAGHVVVQTPSKEM